MPENKRKTGAVYEQKAVEYLKSNGYIIIGQNYRCRIGEIDIIATHQDYLVFVEVKYRKDSKFGLPLQAVDIKKQKVICRVAGWYIVQNKIPADQPVRFDVVSVLKDTITIVENAFEYRA